MNNPSEILSRVAGTKFISTIDLNSAFYQVKLEENSRKYTAFRCFCGSYEFLRGGFGLKNMPKTFQKLINKILQNCQNFAQAHIDDIAIYLPELSRALKAFTRSVNTAEKCQVNGERAEM